MRRSFVFSRVVRQPALPGRDPGKRLGFWLAVGLVFVCFLVNACSSPFGGTGSSTPTSSTQALAKINWCTKPLMVFRDEGAITPTVTATTTATATTTGTATATGTASPTAGSSGTPAGTPTSGAGTPQTVTDWTLVKANLGFTVYLPATLPNGSCLLSVQATIHDPIFGGSFTIGYLLPDHTSLSLSEAPLRSQQITFQCNPTGGVTTPTAGTTPVVTPTAEATQLCSGAKGTTNIVLAGPGTTARLQQIFQDLQPDVNWIPAVSSR